MRIQRFSAGPAVIEALLRGQGPPVILIPGLAGDASLFDPLAEAIAQAGFLAAAVNPRGVGESTGPLEGLTLHDFAADMAGVIEALGPPAHVVGKAFGNRIARCVAADRSDLVRSLVLLNAGGLEGPDEAAAAAFRSLREAAVWEERHLPAMRTALFSPRSDARVWLGMRRWPAAEAAQTCAARATPSKAWWHGGSAPMLVVQGVDDRIAPPANGRALREAFPDRVTLVEIAGAGHALLPEQPRLVAEAVISFFRRHA
jgi:pimeloyl-ACP methyl ester carboxylesterase